MADQPMTTAPAAPDQRKLPTVYALGGPLHGKWIKNRLEYALVVATGPDALMDNTLYYPRRFVGGGWNVPITFWVHQSLIKDGEVVCPALLLPPYLRQPLECCALLPRVRVQ